MKEFVKKLSELINKLKAPKNQFNKFGGYKYRSCEDILEGLKPLLDEYDMVVTVSDEIILVGDRFYIKATATVSDGENSFVNTALAREPVSQKGMSEPQVTGSASSYARKYALNGLFSIDDTKDPDSQDNTGNGTSKRPKKDYKKINSLVAQIKDEMTILCKDKSQQEKGEAILNVLKVNRFDQLNTKDEPFLKDALDRVKLEIKRSNK